MPNEPDKQRNILANNMTALFVMALLFSAFLFFGGNRFLAARFNNPELEKTLLIVAFMPILIIPFQRGNFMATMMVCNRVKLGALFTFITQILPVLGVVLAALIWQSPLASVSGYAVGVAVPLFPVLWLLLRVARGGRFLPSTVGIWKQLKFALPLGVAGMLGLISRSLDKVLVSNFFDPEMFAVYTNGAMQLPLIGVLTASATAVLLPDMRRMFKEGNYEEGLELWKRAAVKCALILLPMMGFLMVMAPEIMTILYGEKYVASAVPFRIYLLLLPIRIAFFGTIFISAGKSNLILIRTIIGLLLNIVLSIILLRVIGYLGAAVATLMVTYLWSLEFNFFWIKKIAGTSYFNIFPFYKVGKIIFIVCLSSIPILILNRVMDISIFIKTFICGFSYILFVFSLFNIFNMIDYRHFLVLLKKRIERLN